jgi:hypothetical protein
MPDNEESRNLAKNSEKAEKTLSYITLGVMALQLVLLQVFKKLLGTILALQIIVHLGMLNVAIPGNTTTFISTLKKFTYFRILGHAEHANYVIFQFNWQQEDALKERHFFKALKALGFKFTNSILNLGNTGQILALEYMSIAVVGLYWLHFKYAQTNAAHRRFHYLQRKLFFKPFLGLCLNGFIPLCICSTINFMYPADHGRMVNYGEFFGLLFTRVIMLTLYVFFPLVMLMVVFVPEEKLQNPDFQNRYGTVFRQIRTTTKAQRCYFLLFIIRRLLLIYAAFFLNAYPCQ